MKQLEKQLKEFQRHKTDEEETSTVFANKTNYKYFIKYVEAVGPLVDYCGQGHYEGAFCQPLHGYSCDN